MPGLPPSSQEIIHGISFLPLYIIQYSHPGGETIAQDCPESLMADGGLSPDLFSPSSTLFCLHHNGSYSTVLSTCYAAAYSVGITCFPAVANTLKTQPGQHWKLRAVRTVQQQIGGAHCCRNTMQQVGRRQKVWMGWVSSTERSWSREGRQSRLDKEMN